MNANVADVGFLLTKRRKKEVFMFLSSLLSPYAIDIFEPIAKWLTIGILTAVLLLGTLLFFLKRKIFSAFIKYAFFGIASYLLVLAILFFAFDIAYHYSDGYAQENWLDKQTLIRFILIPLLIMACISFIELVAFLAVLKYKPQLKRVFGFIFLAVFIAALLAALVCICIYYYRKIDGDGYYNSDTASVKQIALYASAALTVLLTIGLTLFDKNRFYLDSRSLAYAGICVAMSFALSYVKLWDMPNGGSITLVSLLPLMLYSYIFGTKKGVFVGFVYGVLQAVQDPWLIHPAQFLLDYPIAFSVAGLAGIFHSSKRLEKLPRLQFALGAAIAGTLRFICHVLSGVFAFEAYAKGQNAWGYSLIYNLYVFIDMALVVVAGSFVLSSKSFVKTIFSASKEK